MSDNNNTNIFDNNSNNNFINPSVLLKNKIVTKQLYYRLICEHCIETFDIVAVKINSLKGIGAGKDYDGSYDSGRQQTHIRCPVCSQINVLEYSVEEGIKEKRLFRLFQ